MSILRNKFTVESCDDCAGANSTNAEGGVTINDGDGEKEMIVMTGPLSQVATKALGVYFAKTPITDDSVGEVAVESQAIDATVQEFIAQASASNNLFEGAKDRLVLASQYDNFNVNPDTNVIVIPQSNAGTPEVITQVQVARSKDELADRDTVLLIHATDNATSEVDTKVVDINNNAQNGVLIDPIGDEFITPSTESLYKDIKGLKVVVGVKGFGEWVSNKLKKS